MPFSRARLLLLVRLSLVFVILALAIVRGDCQDHRVHDDRYSEANSAADAGAATVPPAYFSMNILFHPLNHVPWPSVPLGGWRTAHVNWADLQPTKDHWYFDLLDKYVAWSLEHQTPILMPLAYTPRWASSDPDAPTDVEVGNPPGLCGAPRDMKDWRIFVRTVAARYKGRIQYWEIWNEPNRRQSWTGSVETLVEMTREAALILKEADPTNVVVSPAPTQARGTAFLEKFLAAGGGKYVDVIGYHFYVDTPEEMPPLIAAVKASMRRNGVGEKPLWNTESGWISSGALSPEAGAGYLARAFLLGRSAGIERFYWYAWEIRSQLQLVQRNNTTLTPAGVAFGVVQEWMTGSRLTGCSASADASWVCGLRRDGKDSHVVWNAKGDTAFKVPGKWRARSIEFLDGRREELHSASIPIGIEPVWIR